MRSSIVRPLTIAVVVLALATAGCSSGSVGGVSVSDAWARPSSGPDQPAAASLVIANQSGQADALVEVTSPAARSIEMHETSMDRAG